MHLPATASHMLAAIYHSFPITLSLFMCGNLFPPSMPSTPPHPLPIMLSSFLAFIYVPFSSISFLKGKINVLPFPAVRKGWKSKYFKQLWSDIFASRISFSYVSSAGKCRPLANPVLFRRPADLGSASSACDECGVRSAAV